MQPYTNTTGIVLPLEKPNVDTDQIIPARFLKRVERSGFGEFLFYAWRYLPDGNLNPDFILNYPQYQHATILVVGPNFGSGSSREHAPWALLDYGFRTIIGTSFADIFRNNCYQNGMLPVILTADGRDILVNRAQTTVGYKITVDLNDQTVTDTEGFMETFEMDAFRRDCLLRGLDDISLTLQHENAIAAYEKKNMPQKLS